MLDTRRTVRRFSSEPIDQEVLDYLLRSAGTSPSGAHTQPWTFAVVTDPELKSAIREIIETEEQINYERRMGKQLVLGAVPDVLSGSVLCVWGVSNDELIAHFFPPLPCSDGWQT